jgi:hypothetical protein
MEPELRFEVSRADLDIAEARRAQSSGDDPTFACTAVKQMIGGLADRRVHDVQRVVKEGRRVCRDAVVAYAGAQVAALQAARPREREQLPRVCIDLSRSVALLEALAPEDHELAGLRAERQALCP